METGVRMVVDYEGALARRVAGDLWGGLSRAALDSGAGYVKTTAVWDSLREPQDTHDPGISIHVFVVEQDLPEAVDSLRGVREDDPLYGLVLAVPQIPSSLAGPLLYQGVERLQESGVKPGRIEPALIRAGSEECERYAGRLMERLKVNR